jgi:hypothetical protein
MIAQTQRLDVSSDKGVARYLTEYTENVATVPVADGGASPSFFERVVSRDLGRSACVYGAAAECKRFKAGRESKVDDFVDNLNGKIEELHGQ